MGQGGSSPSGLTGIDGTSPYCYNGGGGGGFYGGGQGWNGGGGGGSSYCQDIMGCTFGTSDRSETGSIEISLPSAPTVASTAVCSPTTLPTPRPTLMPTMSVTLTGDTGMSVTLTGDTYTVDSPHPYGESVEYNSGILSNPVSSYWRITFDSQSFVENDYDYVFIRDGATGYILAGT